MRDAYSTGEYPQRDTRSALYRPAKHKGRMFATARYGQFACFARTRGSRQGVRVGGTRELVLQLVLKVVREL